LVRPAIAIDVRVFEFEPGDLFVGSALTVRVVKSIEAACSVLCKRMNIVVFTSVKAT